MGEVPSKTRGGGKDLDQVELVTPHRKCRLVTCIIAACTKRKDHRQGESDGGGEGALTWNARREG